MNQPAYLHDRWDDQVAFEEEMMETGKQRMKARIDKAREKHNLGGLRPHRSLLYEWVVPVSQALQRWLNTPKRGTVPISRAPLQQLNADTAAMVALKAVLRMLGMEHRNLLSIAMEIGTNCEHEARMQFWKESDPEDWRTLQQRFRDRKSTSIHQRRSTIAIFNKSKHDELGWLDWTSTERERVGLTMIDMVIEGTQRFHVVGDPAWEPYRIKGGAWAQRPKVLMPDNELAQWMDSALDDELLHQPAFAPTLIPPLDWDGPRGGGYHTPFVKSPVLIRFKANHEEQRQVALEEFEALDMPEVYAAVNYVQRTPWAINTRVLEVAERIFEKDLAIAGIIRQEKIDPPALPEGVVKDTPEYKAWAKIAGDIHAENALRVSRFIAQRRTLTLARRLAEEGEFFFPHHLDFRGRMYSIVSDLSPQGRDLDRGLLTFGRGKPVEEDDEQWLAIHLANVHGVDKTDYAERIKWVKDREARWRQIAADPLDNRLWADEDDPWQCLAAIFEWVRWLDEGPGMISSLPIRVDGTCNGIQHLSAMVRDEEGGRKVNLVPGNRPRDIYMDVGNIVQQLLDDQPLNPHVRMWGRLFGATVPREVAKRPVMIVPYGGTRSAYFKYTLAWLKKHDKDGAAIPKDQRKDAVNLLVDFLLKAVKEVVIRPIEVMEWIQHNCAIASRSGKALCWWTPAGFYVRHFYATEEEYRIETKLDGQLLKLRAYRETKELNTAKQSSGVAPNFVHSMDASALMTCANMLREAGVECFTCIHDAYGTVAGDMWTLEQCLREAFIFTHEQPVLAQFLDACKYVANGDETGEWREVPPMGSLDLGQIRQSDYFFA
ncbi:DNA-directed RNA polymerase [Mesorhizobium sp. B2-8-3]|uniref:DNA-directed RNA polymerase n=1 Tax=Mesorhizobium sp. B2-8-3 TaxID=2589905 RepID=UPI00112E3E66|nr:DNA-directed RNA polymerase [Mesorhizobium sp. B2-8-3]TPJ33649.1 hypothetical protein FJ418_13550 [Mesorhizobium sp. B2-8-3]